MFAGNSAVQVAVNKDNQHSSSTRNSWFTLAGISAAGMALLTALMAWVRFNRPPATAAPPASKPVILPPAPEPIPVAPPVTTDLRRPTAPLRLSGRQQVGLLVLLVIWVVIFIGLQTLVPQLAAVLFALVILSPMVWALWRSRKTLRQSFAQFIIIWQGFYTRVLRPARTWAIAHARLLSTVMSITSIGLMVLAAWSFELTLTNGTPLELGTPVLYLMAGILTLGIALAVQPENLTTVTSARPLTGRTNWPIAALGILALALLSEAGGKIFEIITISTDAQFFLLVIGVTLTIVGLGGLRSLWDGITHFLKKPAVPAGRWLLLAITLLGLGLRAWSLQDSMRFFVDEVAFTSGITRLWNYPNTELLAPFDGIAAFPYLFPYLEEQTIAIFGRNLVGLRAASVILGTLTIPALYLLTRTLFDRKVALLAALLLATFPPHLHFSRIGISEIASPLFGTLAFAFMARAMQSGRRVDYATAGALLGMTHYFHEGGRLFYTPLMVLWIIGCFVFNKSSARPNRSGLLTALLALVIVITPIYYTLIGLGRPLLARMVDNNSGLGGGYWGELFQYDNFEKHIRYHVAPGFLAYVNWKDSTQFYMGHYALIQPLMQPAFFLGIAAALWRWRRPGMMLALGWVVSSSMGNSLMVDSSGSPRFVMVFPALAVLMAIGLRYTLPLFWPIRFPHLVVRAWVSGRKMQFRWPPRLPERYVGVVLAALGILLAAGQAIYYYSEHVPLYNRQFRLARYYADGYDAALRSLDFDDDTIVYIIATNEVNQIESSGMLSFMKSNTELLSFATSDFLIKNLLAEFPCHRDIAFFIEPNDWVARTLLEKNFYLRPPEYSPFAEVIPDERELVLYYAPYLDGLAEVYPRCSSDS